MRAAASCGGVVISLVISAAPAAFMFALRFDVEDVAHVAAQAISVTLTANLLGWSQRS
jgi:hypothetical protein